MKYIKTYEYIVNSVAGQNIKKFVDAVVVLYNHDNIPAISKFFPEEEDSFLLFEIIILGEMKSSPITTLYQIEHFIKEPYFSVWLLYKSRFPDVDNFIKFILTNYDKPMKVTNATWSFNKLLIKNIPKIVEKLSIENFEVFKNASKYNL